MTLSWKKFWPHLKRDIMLLFEKLFQNALDLTDLNYTYLCLIPKVSNASHMVDFRSISLCNIIYKLIVKVLSNRLRGTLTSLISPAQSAFVPERLITDNLIVAFQSLHNIQSLGEGLFNLWDLS